MIDTMFSTTSVGDGSEDGSPVDERTGTQEQLPKRSHGRPKGPPRTDLPDWMLKSEAHQKLMALPRVSLITRPKAGGGIYYYYLWNGRPWHGERILGKIPNDALRKYTEYEAARDKHVHARTMATRERTASQYKALARETVDVLRLVIGATEARPKPGVYFLLGASSEVLYIGKSDNVLARMRGHTEKGFETVRMIHVPKTKDRTRLEARLIKLLAPPMNVACASPNDSTRVLLEADGFERLPTLDEDNLFRL